jgi:DNA-binding transcriptional LysR family regulator
MICAQRKKIRRLRNESLLMTQSPFALDDLHLVAALGAAGSLAQSARRLGVDHSTAFRRLGSLEQRLGVRLFERARTGYAPTPAGEIAIATAQRVLDELGGLERRLAGEDLRPSGTVRVTTSDTMVDFLTPVFAAFHAAHPEIMLEVVVSTAFLTLTRRDADVAVRPAVDPGDTLVGRRVGTVAYAIYGLPRWFGADGAEVLPDADWVGLEESLAHLAAARWMQAHVGPGRIVQRANALSAILAAVRAGLGVAPLPCFIGDPFPELARTAGTLAELETPLWLLTHPDLRRVARIRAFLDFAAEAITARRAMLEGRANPSRGSP